MAVTVSTLLPVHSIELDVATPEQDVTYPELNPAPPPASLIRTVTIALLVSEVALLVGLSAWVWYGMHLYQNCL